METRHQDCNFAGAYDFPKFVKGKRGKDIRTSESRHRGNIKSLRRLATRPPGFPGQKCPFPRGFG
jgi:hypothetical protein